jgi:hypothetical protein
VTSGIGDFTSSNGQGITIPSLLPSALGQVASGIATGISDAGEVDPIQVRRRWAVVIAINTDATVDINLGGVTVPHVSYDASYHPALNETVQVNVVDTDITVIGPTANATYVAYIRRTGQIVKVNTAATAPGGPTSVNVTLTDAQTPVTLLNVPFVSEYFPTVGDTVMLGQGTNTEIYLVLGAVNRGYRRPTGDIEPSILSSKPNALLCNGQAVSRTTYAALWAWVQLNALNGGSSTSWTFEDASTWTAGGNWTVTNSTARAHSGTRSLLATRANTTAGNGYVVVSANVTAGNNYIFSFWTYSSVATPYSCAVDSGGVRIATGAFVPAVNTWELQTISFTSPASATAVSLYITDDPNTSPVSGTMGTDPLPSHCPTSGDVCL